jgi:hypothetical protein
LGDALEARLRVGPERGGADSFTKSRVVEEKPIDPPLTTDPNGGQAP